MPKCRTDDPPLRAGMTATVAIDTGDRHTLKALLGRIGGPVGEHPESVPDRGANSAP